MPSRRTAAAAALVLALALPGAAAAEVFYSMDEAMRAAFPEADRVEKQTLLLTEAQAREVEQLARARLESRLVPVHTGRKGAALLGYALVDIHVVRTQPEAVMVVLSPAGAVESTVLLAFNEPLDYLPPPRWLRQFDGRTLGPDLALGQGIAAIAGATLSSRAVTDAVRRALAVYRVMLAPARR